MWNRIKWWFRERKQRHCQHEWVPAQEFYKERDGKEHKNLAPKMMKDSTKYKVAAYVCRKCYDYYFAIEEVENGDNSLQQDQGGLQRQGE